jgi:carotenoid cleavage dioxygenase
MRFPDEPGFQGRFAPVRLEGEIRGLEVIHGEVPPELYGTYYRVGADPAWPPAPHVTRDFYFNADGMVAMFRFSGGDVDFKTRYVRTPRFVAEREARRSLFGAYRNPCTDDPSVAGLSRGLANTNVYWHAGRLLASKEDSPPVQIDPDTLDTVGEWTWSGDLSSHTATAHPKIDPRDGSLVFFGYAAKGETTPDIAYYEADASGRIIHEAWFTAPYSSMIHDWAVTENFVVFPVIPLTSDADRLKNGGPHYVWDGSQDVYLGVVPRRGGGAGGGTVRWYRGTNRFASHIMNAFDDGRHVYIDTPVGERSAFPWFPDIAGAPFDPEKSRGYLSRWTIDTRANPDEGFGECRLTYCAGEFPRTDDRWATSQYRFGLINLTDIPGQKADDGLPGFRWLASVDPETGAMRTRFAGRDSTVQEAIFVPGAPGAPHGEGYVLVLVDRHETATTELLVLDAAHIDDLPIATLRIPIRMPGGLHGNWVSEQQLRSSARVS